MPFQKIKYILLGILLFSAGYLFANQIGVLVFAHGGDTNLIHSCVGTGILNNGRLRIVGPNDNCNGNETALDWAKGTNLPPMTCPSCSFNAVGTPGNRFVGKHMVDAFLDQAFFTEVDLSGSNLTNASLRATHFESSNLTGTNFTGANFEGLVSANQANFTSSNLTNANMTNASLIGGLNLDTATITGVTWNNTLCPDGTNSNNNGGTCFGHLTP